MRLETHLKWQRKLAQHIVCSTLQFWSFLLLMAKLLSWHLGSVQRTVPSVWRTASPKADPGVLAQLLKPTLAHTVHGSATHAE